MERLDGIVAGVGVLIVLLALGGAVSSGPAGAADFHIAFPEQRLALPDATGSITGEGTLDLRFPVNVTNLTRVEVQLQAVGQGPRVAPDDVTATLRGPDGRSIQAQGGIAGPGTGGEAAALELRLPTGSAPAERDIRAASAGAALAQAGSLASANGTGTWTLSIGVQSQQGLGAAHNEAHAVTARIAAFAFRAVVQPGAPAR
ncbi:MAG: hypothetical protein LC624_07070 [Halobacteriales archaeon]|nr:hypothetical protein [Halobacteriales archaeon]